MTSGSKLFALWPVLLPFSLVNVSGWMHPGSSDRRTGPVIAASRVVSVLLGYTVTVASVLWLLLAGQVVAHAPGTLDGRMMERMPFRDDITRFWIGTAGAALAVVVVLLASVHVGRGFGRFRIDPNAPRPPRWRVWSSTMPDLRSDRFFDAECDHRMRWRLHAAVAVVAAAGVVVYVVGRGTSEPFEPFADVLSVVGGIQAALLVLATFLSIRRPRWWLLSGVGTAAIGVMLVAGLTVSALMLFTDTDALPSGRLLMTFDAYGFAVGAGILVAAGFVVFRLLSPRPDIATSTLDSGGARRRAKLARLSGDVGPVAATVGLTYVVVSTVLFVVRSGREDAESWTLTNTPPVALGRATLLALLTFMVLNLVKARANPASLRRVGTVWDVIAFWPRTFHPFAVRPYAERAVPELRVLLTRGGWDRGLQTTAHSQGAVLVHAALLPVATDRAGAPLPGRSLVPDVGLVTFGSPLRTIYAHAFPHYVDPDDLDSVRGLLEGRWCNVFRYTDHIGRTVFGDDAQPLDPADLALVDPAAGTRQVAGHDGYWATDEVRRIVHDWAAAASDLEGSHR